MSQGDFTIRLENGAELLSRCREKSKTWLSRKCTWAPKLVGGGGTLTLGSWRRFVLGSKIIRNSYFLSLGFYSAGTCCTVNLEYFQSH